MPILHINKMTDIVIWRSDASLLLCLSSVWKFMFFDKSRTLFLVKTRKIYTKNGKFSFSFN